MSYLWKKTIEQFTFLFDTMLSSQLASAVASISKYTPPGVVLGFFSSFLADRKYYGSWVQEFVGTFLMIGFTFTPGKWVGQSSKAASWAAHAVGVVMADYIGGGPHVNPAVSISMFSLGKCDYTEMYVRICGSMTAGLLAFPLFLLLTSTVGLEDLGGPAYHAGENEDGSEGFYNEFLATFLLLVAIYVLNFELHFGKYHYWIKQPLTALVIRYLIEVFPTTGPSLNPMLGTAWAVFDDGQKDVQIGFPVSSVHYLVYWLGPSLGGLFASFLYAIYTGGPFFGKKLPFGPIKNNEKSSPASKSTKKTKKSN